MSLISDALKEAQRERTERTAARAATSIADHFFPYPARRRSSSKHRRLIVGSALGAGVLLATSLIAVHTWPGVAVTARQPARITRGPSTRMAARVHVDSSHGAIGAGDTIPRSHARPALSAAHVGFASTVPEIAARESARPTTMPARPPSMVATNDSATPTSTAKAQGSAARIEPQGDPSGQASSVRVVIDPSSARAGDSLFAQAYTEHQHGNYDRAEELYEKALQTKQVSPDLYNDYGALLARRGRFAAAISMYRRGLATDENNAALWINLADAYRSIGRHADALSGYAEAAKIDPSNGVVNARLGVEYQAIGDTATARHEFETAAAASPNDPMVHFPYAVFLQSQRNYRGAVREFQAFVDLAAGQRPADDIERVRKHIATLRGYYHE